MTKCEQVRRDHFEAFYAEQLGVSVEQLHAMGYTSRPCECGGGDCKGWIMEGDVAQLAVYMLDSMLNALPAAGGSAMAEPADFPE